MLGEGGRSLPSRVFSGGRMREGKSAFFFGQFLFFLDWPEHIQFFQNSHRVHGNDKETIHRQWGLRFPADRQRTLAIRDFPLSSLTTYIIQKVNRPTACASACPRGASSLDSVLWAMMSAQRGSKTARFWSLSSFGPGYNLH
jgi:hypothetical protein